MSELYDRILEQTERLGITGKQLGELLGLKKSPLTDWKNHKSSPTLEQLVKMCEIFSTSSDHLLFGLSTTSAPDLTELIENYEKLDRRGQHRVHTVIYEELSRISMDTDNTLSSK